jgi:hypothetical protein
MSWASRSAQSATPAGGSLCGNMREFGIGTVAGHRIMFGCRVTV